LSENQKASYLFTKFMNPCPITSKRVIKHSNPNPQRQTSLKNPPSIKKPIKLNPKLSFQLLDLQEDLQTLDSLHLRLPLALTEGLGLSAAISQSAEKTTHCMIPTLSNHPNFKHASPVIYLFVS
jgi:hypothetical protein